uniref:Uncharacterized protein n=1 Tax=Eutreptiella gymnastica TaxID=73025 RepID=A0A7S4C7Z3_9EUGL
MTPREMFDDEVRKRLARERGQTPQAKVPSSSSKRLEAWDVKCSKMSNLQLRQTLDNLKEDLADWQRGFRIANGREPTKHDVELDTASRKIVQDMKPALRWLQQRQSESAAAQARVVEEETTKEEKADDPLARAAKEAAKADKKQREEAARREAEKKGNTRKAAQARRGLDVSDPNALQMQRAILETDKKCAGMTEEELVSYQEKLQTKIVEFKEAEAIDEAVLEELANDENKRSQIASLYLKYHIVTDYLDKKRNKESSAGSKYNFDIDGMSAAISRKCKRMTTGELALQMEQLKQETLEWKNGFKEVYGHDPQYEDLQKSDMQSVFLELGIVKAFFEQRQQKEAAGL